MHIHGGEGSIWEGEPSPPLLQSGPQHRGSLERSFREGGGGDSLEWEGRVKRWCCKTFICFRQSVRYPRPHPLPLQNYPNCCLTVAELRGHAESLSTGLLIFTPRDSVLPKGSKLQGILQGITPALETLQGHGCHGSSFGRETGANVELNLVQPRTYTHPVTVHIHTECMHTLAVQSTDTHTQTHTHSSRQTQYIKVPGTKTDSPITVELQSNNRSIETIS